MELKFTGIALQQPQNGSETEGNKQKSQSKPFLLIFLPYLELLYRIPKFHANKQKKNLLCDTI